MENAEEKPLVTGGLSSSAFPVVPPVAELEEVRIGTVWSF